MQKQANCTKGEVGEKKKSKHIPPQTIQNLLKKEKYTHTQRQRKIESLHRRVRSVSML